MNEPELQSLPPDDPIDLLERPVFSVSDADGNHSVVSLAELLARLSNEQATELAQLMPHQQHVMHAFVVQLMALVAARGGLEPSSLSRTAEGWRDALRQLAGSAEAFQLVVKDLSKPAFLQPPVMDGSLDKFKDVSTPDSLDVLVLAKNHDVKAARIRYPRIEHWVFALLSLQTQQGFSGRDNYGVARMNGGFGNRPGFGMTPSLEWARRVLRDVRVALKARPALFSDTYPYQPTGTALLWVEPWDGTVSSAMASLDPFFIEICRRVRVTRGPAGLQVLMTSTKVPRLEGKIMQGSTGDLWTPVDVVRGAALTLPGAGLTYARMSQLLFDDDWVRPAALELSVEDGDHPLAVARALVRGQGKTEGLHERVVMVPPRTRNLFARPQGRARLGSLAKQRIEAARTLRLKVLKPAVCALLQGGADDLRFDDDRGDWLLDEIDRRVDSEFFPRLFEDVHLESDAAEARFQEHLRKLGEETLELAIRSLPTSASRRERAIAAAEGRFWGGLRKNFPLAFQAADTANQTEETVR